MVVLLGVDALLIRYWLDWTAFSYAFTYADIWDILKHTNDGLLVRIVFWELLVGTFLVVDPRSMRNFRLHLFLLATREGEIDDDMICGVKKVKTDVI